MKNNLLQKNEIYNSQFAMMFFFIALVFKVTRLTRIISLVVGDMVLLTEVVICAADIFLLVVVYFYTSMNGFQISKERYPVLTKILFGALLLLFALKFLFYYASAATYIISTLFRSIKPFIVILTLMIPVAYLAVKGIVTISRVTEILFWIVFALIVFNIAFMDAEMKLARLLPIMTEDIGPTANKIGSLGLWVGDFLPLLLVKLKKKKFPYIPVAAAASYTVVLINIIIAVCTFGSAVFVVENIFVLLPTYNEFAFTLGKLDWAGIIPWFIMTTISLTTGLWGIVEIGETFFKKRAVFAAVIIALQIVALCSVSSLEYIITFAYNNIMGIIFWAGFLLIPLALLLVAFAAKKKNEEEKPQKAQADTPILLENPSRNGGGVN